MKRYLTISLLFHLCFIALGQPYLEKSKFEDRYVAVLETNSYVTSYLDSRRKYDTSKKKYFTYVFSNSSGIPMVAIYQTHGEPLLLHDWELNKIYYLRYTVIEKDTILFYTDIFDFYPNGVAEDFIKGFEVFNDSIFDKYYYPLHWYEGGLDDPPYLTFKIKRSGRLVKVDRKKFLKKSKWYKKTYSNIPPPPPPPKIPREWLDQIDEE